MAYLVVTPDQYAEYMNGQPILPIQVLLPEVKPKKDLFEKIHDFTFGKIFPNNPDVNPDYYEAAQFDKSDYVSEPVLESIRAGFSYYLVCNMLTTFWLNTDGIMHMIYFFTYWGVAATMWAIVYS